jgi:hypothetical protein
MYGIIQGMAKTVITTDDIDGSANAETVEFSFDGANYVIDLTKKNRTALEKALKPYIDAAKRAPSRGRPPTSGRIARRSSRRGPAVDLAAVRAWAAENGHVVSSRGRIAQSVVDAYKAATG